jgi:hypothetical protein
MKWLRNSLLLLAGIVTVLFVLAAHYYYRGFHRSATSRSHPVALHSLPVGEADKLSGRLAGLKQYAVAHGYNDRIAFLADMQLPSGKNRFFVCDLSGDSILLSGLVAHGCGAGSFSATPSFSNTNGSNCTSLGRYRIGQPYKGQFGLSYKLYGLDTTNNHAFSRNVVLHSYAGVPEGETDPFPICNSRGCAMVSPGFLSRLQPLINKSGRPLLLEIFQ